MKKGLIIGGVTAIAAITALVLMNKKIPVLPAPPVYNPLDTSSTLPTTVQTGNLPTSIPTNNVNNSTTSLSSNINLSSTNSATRGTIGSAVYIM